MKTRPRLLSFDDLCKKAELAVSQARKAATRYPEATVLCLAACRIWSMRAEYALMHGAIQEEHFAEVDKAMNEMLGISMH